MKTTQRGILAIAAIFLILALVGYALPGHGQSDAQLVANAILQPLASGAVPETGTFYTPRQSHSIQPQTGSFTH